MTPKAVVIPFAIIDMETGGLFLMKGARRPHIALALVRFARVPHNLLTHHLGKRGPGAQFIKETWGQTHNLTMGQRAHLSKGAVRFDAFGVRYF